jgi:hypothetical protein
MPVPEIVRLALEYKDGLDNLNRVAVTDLASRYVRINNALDAQIKNLLGEISALGRVPTESWVRELNYYQALQEQVTISSRLRLFN